MKLAMQMIAYQIVLIEESVVVVVFSPSYRCDDKTAMNEMLLSQNPYFEK